MSGEREEGKIFAVVEGGSRRRGSAWLLKFKLNEHVRGEFMKLEKTFREAKTKSSFVI